MTSPPVGLQGSPGAGVPPRRESLGYPEPGLWGSPPPLTPPSRLLPNAVHTETLALARELSGDQQTKAAS